MRRRAPRERNLNEGSGVKNLDSTGLKSLHREWRRRAEPDVALLLDSVQTPYNVGAILRTAAAYRVSHLWFAGATSPPTHGKVAKTALGTGRYLTWTICDEVDEALVDIASAGYGLVGLELAEGAQPVKEVAFGERTCLALATRTGDCRPPCWRPATPWPTSPNSARWAASTSGRPPASLSTN
ncbi:MAG: hypothetical protein CM1200mP26_27970 [Acidimicrobiales bacterium]|nr:MAG: hypothetical protein CM1200mP26_27970 [Acidimicrobiales bacterium]